MDVERMREYVEFSKSLNFTATARVLHLSQPSLSKHVRDMEVEVGASFVKRSASGTGNELTPAGLRFAEFAAEFVRGFDAVVDECRELDAAAPPARIQDVRHGFNVVARLCALLREHDQVPGNFAYVKTDLPIRAALDQGIIDFAVHLEPTPHMALFASEELRGNYGWLLLGAEPVCFLVGEGNRLFGCGEADLADIAAQEVVCGGSPAYESWYAALPTVFLREGCALSLKAVPDAALDGGAYPVGSKRLCLCTERFASYYADLGVETVEPLRVRGLSPEVHSFAVFRRDNVNALVQRIASCSERG